MGTKISALPAAGTLTGTEIVVMDQAGNTVTAPSGNMGIWVRTAAEIAAGVTPTNYAYPPGCIERYGNLTTSLSGSAANTAIIQTALNSGETDIFSAYGWLNQYPVNAILQVPANVLFRDVSLIATANMAPTATEGDGQIIALMGNYARVHRVQTDGNQYYAGGVAAYNGTTGNEIVGCYIHSATSYNGSIDVNSPAQAISLQGAKNFRVLDNYCYDTRHGIQHWQCASGVIDGNVCLLNLGGGIWGTDSENLSITGNTISDCADVGLDMEGGVNCVTSGNTVRNANNGELSWFKNGTGSGRTPVNCLFTANNCYRSSTYLQMVSGVPTATACNAQAGGIQISSVTFGQSQIVFKGNSVYNSWSDSFGLLCAALGNGASGLAIEGNDIQSVGSIFLIQEAQGIVVSGNTFRGLPGSESLTNVWKDCFGGVFDDNEFIYTNTKTTTYALQYYTDNTDSTANPYITNNRFYNCADLAFQHNPFTSAVRAILSGNQFTLNASGSAYTPNGGCVSTTNGYPIFRNQDLLLGSSGTTTTTLTLNSASISALGGSDYYGSGKMMIIDPAQILNTYEIVSPAGGNIVSRDGTGSGSGTRSSSVVYASFSTQTATASAPSGDTVSIRLRLNLDSYN